MGFYLFPVGFFLSVFGVVEVVSIDVNKHVSGRIDIERTALRHGHQLERIYGDEIIEHVGTN